MAEISNNEITLKDLLNNFLQQLIYLKSKSVIIIIAVIIGGLIGGVYAFTKKNIYNASLTFALEDDKASGGGLNGALGLASSLGFDLGGSAGGAFSGANLLELMKSRKLVEQTLLRRISVNKKGTYLLDLYLDFNGIKSRIDSKILNDQIEKKGSIIDRTNFTLKEDSLLGVISKRIINDFLAVSQIDKKISIYSINVKCENEIFAKFFIESLAKEVSDFYIDTKSKRARNNVMILEKQVDSIRTALNNAITGVAIANDNTYNLNAALNINRTPSIKRQIDVQANGAILNQLVANLELARVSLRKETPLIQIIDTPILPLDKTQLSKTKAIVVGAMLSALLLIIFLICQRYIKSLYNNLFNR